jgi:RecB family endonuclease NucS
MLGAGAQQLAAGPDVRSSYAEEEVSEPWHVERHAPDKRSSRSSDGPQQEVPVPLFEMTPDNLVECKPVTFAHLEIREREGLQRVLRDHIEVLGDDLLVIAEEYGDWEDARRRIDLLALDKELRLVVIELKRTDTGSHMDLQAVRYAAMVSAMTFD